MPSIKEQKQRLREHLRIEIKQLNKQRKKQESAIVRERLANYIREHIPESNVIASFAGLPSEPELLELHELLPSHKIAYPKCGPNRTMEFYLVNDVDTELISGTYGIREPNDVAENKVAIPDIALFIVPAFAYTPNGIRLGKGGGYYDRALILASKNAPRVGVIFSIQMLSNIPTETHDIPVDLVITAD